MRFAISPKDRTLLAMVAAGWLVVLASGCAATQPAASSASSGSVVAAGEQPLPQCVPGWNQCVCEKEAKCCNIRQECSCTGGGTAGYARCS